MSFTISSRFAIAAECLLLALGLAACGSTNAQKADGKKGGPGGANPPAPVKVSTVESRTVPVEIIAVGKVEPYTTIAIRPQIGGTLVAVNFKEGDFVKQGDVMFEIDPRPYDEAIREADANLNRSKAALSQAEASLNQSKTAVDLSGTQKGRIDKLVKEGVFAREQSDNADSDYKTKVAAVDASQANVASAKASVGASEAALSRSKLDLTYTKITAPISGRTGNLAVKQGNLVRNSDTEMVSILEIQPIYVTFSIPESQLPEVRNRMRTAQLQVLASLQGVDKDTVQGRITFLDNAVDPTTGTIQLKGTFPNTNSKLWPGQFVNVKLRLNQLSNATIVAPSALMNGQNGEFVFVVKQDQTVEMRPVKIALRGDGFIAISSGVAPGESVVIDGQVRLVPGSKVKVVS